jgi:predicted DNA-binding protein with PD1-like motif
MKTSQKHRKMDFLRWLPVCLMLFSGFGCNRTPEHMETLVLRLKPGEDVKKVLQEAVDREQIDAGWVITAVGSLTDVHLRYANRPQGTKLTGHFEVVSLTGTLSRNGSHLHMSVSDSNGVTTGGHLLDANIVYTTLELVIGWRRDLVFTREEDGTTPWKELVIRNVEK